MYTGSLHPILENALTDQQSLLSTSITFITVIRHYPLICLQSTILLLLFAFFIPPCIRRYILKLWCFFMAKVLFFSTFFFVSVRPTDDGWKPLTLKAGENIRAHKCEFKRRNKGTLKSRVNERTSQKRLGYIWLRVPVSSLRPTFSRFLVNVTQATSGTGYNFGNISSRSCYFSWSWYS